MIMTAFLGVILIIILTALIYGDSENAGKEK